VSYEADMMREGRIRVLLEPLRPPGESQQSPQPSVYEGGLSEDPGLSEGAHHRAVDKPLSNAFVIPSFGIASTKQDPTVSGAG